MIATPVRGIDLGGLKKKEAQLTKHLVTRFPSIEKVRFCNSGSEADTMAFGTAKAHPRRKKVP
jgi:glutamate-1-semialdehyde 2,1-aminomutase